MDISIKKHFDRRMYTIFANSWLILWSYQKMNGQFNVRRIMNYRMCEYIYDWTVNEIFAFVMYILFVVVAEMSLEIIIIL